jgi:chromosomal replication initiator protein
MPELWDSALTQIENKINPDNFDLWLRPIECTEIDGSRIHLRAPNRFVRDWFQDNYLEAVLELLRSSAQHDFEVTFEIVETTPAPVLRPDVVRAAETPSPATNGLTSPGLETVASVAPTVTLVPGDSPVASPQKLDPRLTFDRFVMGTSNQLAYMAARAVAEAPASRYNPLFICGGTGLGKTHLLHAIGNEIFAAHPNWRITYLSCEDYMNEFINGIRVKKMDDFRRRYREECDVLLMDDIQFIAGKDSTQDEFFHTFNSLHQAARQIVLTADKYPHEIQALEERLRSRFQWGLVADVRPPELETRIAILKKKADAEMIPLPDDVAHFLARTFKQNVRELHGALIRVAAYASLSNRPITVGFAQEILASAVARSAENLTCENVQKEVSSYYNVKLADLKGSRRHQAIARPRQVAMYLARKLVPGASFPLIGRAFGDKDHTTVIAACRKIEKLLGDDASLRADLANIEKLLQR